MDVLFRDDELRECATNQRKAKRKFGRQVALKYIERIHFLKQIDSTLSIPASWRFHPLKGKRDGEFAIDINWKKGVRLVVTLPGPGQICIEEVNTDHYD